MFLSFNLSGLQVEVFLSLKIQVGFMFAIINTIYQRASWSYYVIVKIWLERKSGIFGWFGMFCSIKRLRFYQNPFRSKDDIYGITQLLAFAVLKLRFEGEGRRRRKWKSIESKIRTHIWAGFCSVKLDFLSPHQAVASYAHRKFPFIQTWKENLILHYYEFLLFNSYQAEYESLSATEKA